MNNIADVSGSRMKNVNVKMVTMISISLIIFLALYTTVVVVIEEKEMLCNPFKNYGSTGGKKYGTTHFWEGCG